MDPATIGQLLDEIGFPHQRVPDHEAAFNIQIELPDGAFVHAAVHDGAPHALVVSAGQRLENEAWTETRRLTRRDCSRMAARLEQLLLVSEVDYALKREPAGGGSCVRELSVRSIVDEADLSRSALRRHVTRVHRTRQLLRTVWEEFRP